MRVNRASTISGLAFGIIMVLRNDIYLHCMYRPPFNTKMIEGTLRLSPKIERQRSVNDFCFCILRNQWAVCQLSSIIEVMAACIGKNASDDITSASKK